MRLDRELACQEVVELVTAYLEDGLDPADRERFEEHLVFCDGCENYLAQMRTTVRLTGRADQGLAGELEAELLEAFRSWRAS
jgi:anti-sigma factor RsiW